MGKNLGDPHHRVPLQPNESFNSRPVLLLNRSSINCNIKYKLPNIIYPIVLSY